MGLPTGAAFIDTLPRRATVYGGGQGHPPPACTAYRADGGGHLLFSLHPVPLAPVTAGTALVLQPRFTWSHPGHVSPREETGLLDLLYAEPHPSDTTVFLIPLAPGSVAFLGPPGHTAPLRPRSRPTSTGGGPCAPGDPDRRPTVGPTAGNPELIAGPRIHRDHNVDVDPDAPRHRSLRPPRPASAPPGTLLAAPVSDNVWKRGFS